MVHGMPPPIVSAFPTLVAFPHLPAGRGWQRRGASPTDVRRPTAGGRAEMRIVTWPRVIVKFLDDDDVRTRFGDRSEEILPALLRLEAAPRGETNRLLDDLLRLVPANVDFAGQVVERVITDV